jgi:putative intracellular protease/amidase
MQIALLLFPGITPLDAVGPYEVLQRMPETSIRFVAKEPGAMSDRDGGMQLVADASFDDVARADLLLVPGGFGTRALIDDVVTLDWIRSVDAATDWTTSVCTGSLLLAAAGLLDGRPATTHWLHRDLLRELGAVPTEQRVVTDGKYVTAAGVSAGIDMALELVARIHGADLAQSIQLAIEYDPRPPFDSGSPDKAPAEIVDRLRRAAATR